ncbi:hypothetical protein [Methylobacterium sp. GC_Met_2]|uniref:hypothetical protein n=1 Tax=Methylobacterium sp. GC_Met_2 TaxID=2937376 RepID=UPI00226BAC03|nr:hypothetical protein [Methylobacterium sp. GC_Met_2]
MSNAYHSQRPQPRATAQQVVNAMVKAHTAAATPRANSRGLARADMLQQLEARGTKPAA